MDLNGGRIEVYTEPSAAGSRATRLFVRGEQFSPAVTSDLVIAVDASLGPDGTDARGEQEPPAQA